MELKNETRESFIFHAEYIADIPEELQPQYAMHAINSALKGIEPELKDWRDIKMWNAIKSRIDQERELYEKKCNNLKQKQKKTPDTEKGSSDTENDTSETENAKSDGVYESEFVSEFVSEHESENVLVPDPEPEKAPSRETPSVVDFSNKIYTVFHEAGLPCARNNPISFLQRDYKNAMGFIRSNEKLKNLRSEDILQACKNYAATVNDPASFITGKYSFDRFVTFKNFTDYLPDNYVPENFKDEKKVQEAGPKPKREWKIKCPGCGVQALTWDNDRQKYRCASCGHEYAYEEINR